MKELGMKDRLSWERLDKGFCRDKEIIEDASPISSGYISSASLRHMRMYSV